MNRRENRSRSLTIPTRSIDSAAFKKADRADFATERKALDYIADDYSIDITKENIQALITAAGVEEAAKKLGAEKVFTADKQ